VRSFSAGQQVASAGAIYACKPHPFTGWCGMSNAYEPGIGFAWQDAWDLKGPCTTSSVLTSRYFKNDADAQAVARGERTLTLPTNLQVENFGIQWRVVNALRMLGKESQAIATGEVIDATKLRSIDQQLVTREALFDADAARLPNYSNIYAPDFRDNIPQKFAVHLMVRTLDLFNAGTTKYQTLSNQCVLANLIPQMCGVLADFGTVDGRSCNEGGTELRAQQIVQSPDLFGFSGVRRAIGAQEYPIDPSIPNTCYYQAVLVHEIVHDLDQQYHSGEGSWMERGFPRTQHCSPNLVNFLKPGHPFVYTGINGQQNPALFVSGYAAGLTNEFKDYRPWEDIAETVTAYMVFPEYFRVRAQANAGLRAKYEYVKNNMFGGTEFQNTNLAPIASALPFVGTSHEICNDSRLQTFRADDIKVKN
jgi:hypothetical protein